MTHILIHDESPTGRLLNQVLLELESRTLTVGQLIRRRIEQECRDLEEGESSVFSRQPQRNDAHIALRSFRRTGFRIFIDNRPVRNLDQQIELTANTRVRFVEMR